MASSLFFESLNPLHGEVVEYMLGFILLWSEVKPNYSCSIWEGRWSLSQKELSNNSENLSVHSFRVAYSMGCATYLLLTATRITRNWTWKQKRVKCDTASGPGAADREGANVEVHFIDLSSSGKCHCINGRHKSTLTSCTFQLSVI